MEKLRAFLKRKDIVFSAKRYFIDAMGAMAQGLFCTLLVGTILNTIGQQFHIGFLNAVIVTIGKGDGAVNYTIGGLCSAMVGPGMAVAIARALNAPPLVLFSLIPVGFATNYMGDAGGPLAVLFVAIVAAEMRQGRQQGDEDRHSGDAHRHRAGGRGLRRADRRAGGHGGLRRGTRPSCGQRSCSPSSWASSSPWSSAWR